MGPAPALIASTLATDAQAAATYIDDQTSDDAYVLAALTTQHDASLHHIVLDPASRTVWWAYNNQPLERHGWTVDHLSPETAAKRASERLETILDRQDHPERYAAGHGDLNQGQAALDDYAAVLRLLVSADPAAAAEAIRARRAQLAARMPCGNARTSRWCAPWSARTAAGKLTPAA
jgi:hypothetical protein